MILDIYESTNYKKIVLSWIEHPANKKSGVKKELAQAISCQAPFVSHVLNGDYHFSPEQAYACAQWMGLNESETDYFSLLVTWQRAGSNQLKNHLYQKIQKIRKDEVNLKKKVSTDQTLSSNDQITYYSSWHYCAIHMALLNKNLQTFETLQKHFQLSSKRLRHVIDFLIQIGVVTESKGYLKVTKTMIHLEKGSSLVTQHHINWRVKALENLQQSSNDFDNEDLNYSGAISLSEEDFSWIKQKLSALLKEVADKVQNSDDEKLICLNFDCFEI